MYLQILMRWLIDGGGGAGGARGAAAARGRRRRDEACAARYQHSCMMAAISAVTEIMVLTRSQT